MIEIQLDGVRYDGFLSVLIERDIENLCGRFEFESSTLDGGNLPIKRMQKCVALIDGTPIITGYIDSIDIEYMIGNHRVIVSGRDKTQDIQDSTVDTTIELTAPITLVGIIQKVLTFLGTTDIKIINTVSDLEPFNSSELVSGQVGQNAFTFLDQFCSKRQVLLTTDGNGDLVITRGTGNQVNAALVHQIDGLSNNIKRNSVKYEDQKRFHKYIVRSQANASAPAYDDTEPLPKTISSIKGISLDAGVRPSRVMVINAEKASSVDESVNRAQWERDIRRARALNATILVQGHHHMGDTGPLWQPLQLIKVTDDYAGIDDLLIIRKVKYMVDLSGATVTEIDVVPKDAFLLLSESANKKSKKKKKGKGGVTQADINSVKAQFGLTS